LDWHKAYSGWNSNTVNDPGVISVKEIAKEFGQHGFKTKVMAASFRNVEEILELSGIDLLTVSPKFLQQLNTMNEPVKAIVKRGEQQRCSVHLSPVTQDIFLKDLENDKCALELLNDGIKKFINDTTSLEDLIGSRIK
jgi:transaldolase